MSNNTNSISTMLPKFIKLFNNSVESYNKFTEAMISNSKEIFVEIVDENGDTKKVPITSFKYILKELERLNLNIQQLSGLSEDKVTTVKIDESFRKVTLSNYRKESNDINELQSVKTFNFRVNHFFESLMNPFLYINFDLSTKIDKASDSILAERYILKDLNEDDRDWFNETYNQKNDIDRDTFISSLNQRNIFYTLDSDTINLPPKELIYDGFFDVLSINEIEVEEVVGDQTFNRKRKQYKLNKLTYTDLRYDFIDNVSLKEGDLLITKDDSTAYKIISIDNTNTSVVLELRDGYTPIKNGSAELRFYSESNIQTNCQIGVGFNEYNVLFIKSINSEYKIPARNWSTGVGYFTNDLTIDRNGDTQTLDTFYKEEVADFGAYLQSIAMDKIVPTSLGLIPDAPTIENADFQVVQINKQINTNKTVEDIKNIEKEKNQLQSEINELIKAIEKDKTNESLVNEKASKTELYNSLVRELDNKAADIELNNYVPKYRLRGFFPIPSPKYEERTGNQEVIRFLISYRYISKAGNANSIDQFEYDDEGTTRVGAFSNWNEIHTALRAKEFNEETQQMEWADQKVEDADAVNINSIDLPITKNESIEIRIRSLSEAGYPNNPLISDWSATVTYTFPDDLDTEGVLDEIVEQNKKDLVRVNLQDELTNVGLYEHLNTSYQKNDKYYPHRTDDIDSGFVSDEQNVINLYNKLKTMDNEIIRLNEELTKQNPVLNVKLIDSEGNEIAIRKDQQNKVFAGYYTDYIDELNIKKGKIVTKTYFLILENANQSDLQLVSRIPGSITKRVKVSEPDINPDIESAVNPNYENYGTYESADYDYNTIRKYDLVPLMLSNPSDKDGEIINFLPYQSAQVKSQYVYNRYFDIAKENNFYGYYIPDDDGNSTATQITTIDHAENKFGRAAYASDGGFIWGGGFDVNDDPDSSATYYNSDDNTIEAHINHPLLKSRLVFEAAYLNETGNTSTGDYLNEAKELFKQSKFMTLKSDSELGKKQSIYVYEDTNGRTVKMAFEANDEYLLGKKSCGAYLFMSPEDQDFVAVEGKSLLSKRTIEYGNENSVKIPILFQFRMTDYYGEDTNGLGNIGGDVNQLITNLTYTKEIGFDIYDENDNLFSFDLEVTARYKPDGLSMDKIPVKKIGLALDDIAKNLENAVVRSDNLA
jgi:hypothetical protein